ncbi:R3H domain protein [Paraliobacillus sp. PM-2]|uniref:RNA-binding cell elongation regulator Jag/EloR n=1 Tax=Paraliobacillus sp. PM-2 TaxID=1462524 RepID=UPI00061C942A|nr:RNA-binding cell elongation regulator Jag/EloR [Paraliobacillus sp. PM-2]CQR45802.1 R3H domain protein [Paraliobacillus sp. PM-2]
MRQVTASGQTVEDAVQSALKQLNTTEDQVNVEIIDEGKKGILGLFGSKRAIVKVTVAEDPIQLVKDYLTDILTGFTNEIVKVEPFVQGNTITFELTGEKLAMIIGKRGQTLNAMQYLVQTMINRKAKERYNIIVDAEGYRERRKQTLEQLAHRLADKATKINKHVSLEPMPSFERKIIHGTLQDNHKVETYSDGVDPHRHVVIKPMK